MQYRIAGFSDRGEARIVDEHGRQVAVGELRVETLTEPERGDLLGVELHVVWNKREQDEMYERVEPDLWDGTPVDRIDWDAFPR